MSVTISAKRVIYFKLPKVLTSRSSFVLLPTSYKSKIFFKIIHLEWHQQ